MIFGNYVRFRDVPSSVLRTIRSIRRGEDISKLVDWGRETGCLHKTGRVIVLNLRCDMCAAPAVKQLFEVRKALKQGSRDAYCSKVCSQRHHSMKHKRPCEVCGKPARGRHTRYCSPQCVSDARSARRRRRPCPYCGRLFTGYNAYCSGTCADLVHSKRMRGARNSRFVVLGRYSNLFRAMAEVVRTRDGHRCAVCTRPDSMIKHCRGRKRSILQVHHIDENTRHNKPENLITLCMSCHSKCHLGTLRLLVTLASLAHNRSLSMTSRLRASATSLLAEYSLTTASS